MKKLSERVDRLRQVVEAAATPPEDVVAYYQDLLDKLAPIKKDVEAFVEHLNSTAAKINTRWAHQTTVVKKAKLIFEVIEDCEHTCKSAVRAAKEK